MQQKIATGSVLIALAIILSYIEVLIPFGFLIPGVKLGLSNLVVVIALYQLKKTDAFVIAILRILLAGFLFGNLFSILYSLAGGLFSFIVMIITKKTGKFSIMGVSICGGVSHNMGQILIAMLLVKTMQIRFYIPVLLVSGMLTGALIGVIAASVLRKIKNIDFKRSGGE